MFSGADQAVGGGGAGREPGQPGFEDGDVAGGGALLRAVDGGGAVRAEQRVVDVDGHHHLHAFHADESGDVDAGQLTQRGAARGQFLPVGVEEAGAQGLGQARAPVGGGAAAQPEDHEGRAALDRVGHELTGAVTGRGERPGRAGQPAQP